MKSKIIFATLCAVLLGENVVCGANILKCPDISTWTPGEKALDGWTLCEDPAKPQKVYPPDIQHHLKAHHNWVVNNPRSCKGYILQCAYIYKTAPKDIYVTFGRTDQNWHLNEKEIGVVRCVEKNKGWQCFGGDNSSSFPSACDYHEGSDGQNLIPTQGPYCPQNVK